MPAAGLQSVAVAYAPPEEAALRILETVRSVEPEYGGTTETLRQLSVRLASDFGVEVEVASIDDPNSPNVKAFPLKVHALGPAKSGYGYSPQFTEWIRTHLHEFDMVVINGIWSYQSYGAYRAIRGSGKPYFVFPHGMLDPYFNMTSTLKRIKKNLYWDLFEGKCLRDATKVMFTCEEERRLAQGSFKNFHCNEAVVALGTAGPDVDLDHCRGEFLKAFPELQGKRIRLFISRIDPKKGIDLMIRAIARLPREDDVMYVIAGPDKTGMQPALTALATELGVQDKLFWPGMITGCVKWGAFAAAEVLILPSHQENFGFVLAEAMACGTPVMTTNKVNIWHEIVESGAGYVENDDLEGIEKLLKTWTSLSDSQREAHAERAKSTFQERFEVKRAAEVVYEVYRQELAKAGKG